MLALGLALNGLGHGALAGATGILGGALARSDGGRFGGWSVLEVAYVGLAGASVKAIGSILLAFVQTYVSGIVTSEARSRLLLSFVGDGFRADARSILASLAVRLKELETAVGQGAVGRVRALAQLAPIVLGLIFVSPSLALVGSLVAVPIVAGLAALRRGFKRANEEAQNAAVALHAGVQELIENLDLWRAYGASARAERAIAEAEARAITASARADGMRAALSGTNEVLGALAIVGAIALAARAGVGFGDGTLIAFVTICFMAYRPLRDLGEARAACIRGNVALDALEASMRPGLDVFDGERRDERPSTAARAPFAVEPKMLELRDFGAEARGPRTSFVLARGECVAIVGPTGSGKTTLLRALLGLESNAGSVRFDGDELGCAGVGPGQRPFAWVPQSAPLVTGTVLENVALFAAGPSPGRLALAELGAERLLGLAGTVIGPGGRALSGGERRLVAIARALATELPVLLLDEPTEGLDPASRARVLSALARVKGRRSVVIVTHHADVAALADQVIDIEASERRSVLAAE